MKELFRFVPVLASFCFFSFALNMGVQAQNSDQQSSQSNSRNIQTSTLTVSTYNVGLAYNFVPMAKERKPHLLKALRESESDVLCLQEVWSSQDNDDFKRELSQKYPYVHYVAPRQKFTDRAPACYLTDLLGRGKFGTCLMKNCLSKKGDDFTQCVVGTCRTEMNQLKKANNQCAAAFFAQVGKPVAKGVATVLNPFRKVGLYAYEGSSGILLFSKYPLENKEVMDWHDKSTINRRAALYATVTLNQKKHHLLCTHLTADLESTIPYTGPFQTWEEENGGQIADLLAFMKGKAGQDPQFLLGDFNCGLGDPQINLKPEYEKNCQQIFSAGFQDRLVQSHPECTFCSHNTLNSKDKTQDVLIDHIFVKNLIPSTRMESEVIFKEQVTEEGVLPASNLSDHFGVRTRFVYP